MEANLVALLGEILKALPEEIRPKPSPLKLLRNTQSAYIDRSLVIVGAAAEPEQTIRGIVFDFALRERLEICVEVDADS